MREGFLSILKDEIRSRHGLTATEASTVTVADVEKAPESFGFAEDQPGYKKAQAPAAKQGAGKRTREEIQDDEDNEEDEEPRLSSKRYKTRSMTAVEAGRSRPSAEMPQLDVSSPFLSNPNSRLSFGDETSVQDTSIRTIGSTANDVGTDDIYQENLERVRAMIHHCAVMIRQFPGGSYEAEQAVFAHQAVRAMAENPIRTALQFLRVRGGVEENAGDEEDKE